MVTVAEACYSSPGLLFKKSTSSTTTIRTTTAKTVIDLNSVTGALSSILRLLFLLLSLKPKNVLWCSNKSANSTSTSFLSV